MCVGVNGGVVSEVNGLSWRLLLLLLLLPLPQLLLLLPQAQAT